METCNKISITHYKVLCFFVVTTITKWQNVFSVFIVVFFCSVMWSCQSHQILASSPSCQWVDCLYLHCPVADNYSFCPSLVFRFWISLVYSWNIYNLGPKWWFIWGIWKITVTKWSMITLAVKYLVILKISTQNFLTFCLVMFK